MLSCPTVMGIEEMEDCTEARESDCMKILNSYQCVALLLRTKGGLFARNIQEKKNILLAYFGQSGGYEARALSQQSEGC